MRTLSLLAENRAATGVEQHLVAKPVGALDSVISVPPPVILAHVPQRSIDAALCCNCVAAGREQLCDAPAQRNEYKVEEAETGAAERVARS